MKLYSVFLVKYSDRVVKKKTEVGLSKLWISPLYKEHSEGIIIVILIYQIT